MSAKTTLQNNPTKQSQKTMYIWCRRLLFLLPAEMSHNISLNALALISRSQTLCNLTHRLCHTDNTPVSPTKIMGLEFPNPVGLAAGLDKHGVAANAFAAMGFGFIEQGTVTPLPQSGNPKPRLHRLKNQQALINRMGFNSKGLDSFMHNVSRPTYLPSHAPNQSPNQPPIRGINIGKNAATANSNATQDYLVGLRRVYKIADYITINLSSPNTKNLRDLQNPEALAPLLSALNHEREKLVQDKQKPLPLVIKISPDLSPTAIASIAALARKHKIDGIAATNTTVQRDCLKPHRHAHQAGGLSGAPLCEKSTQTIAELYKNLQGEIAIIGIGGIMDAASAQEKMSAGADLIQLYTGLIYQGPALIQQIIKQHNSFIESQIGEST